MVNFLHFTKRSDNFCVYKIKPQLMADVAATMCSSHCHKILEFRGERWQSLPDLSDGHKSIWPERPVQRRLET